MILIVAFAILAIIGGLLDGSWATADIIMVIGAVCYISSFRVPYRLRRRYFLLCAIVSVGYILSAYIVSLNFQNNDYFLALDSVQYTQQVKLQSPDDDYWSLIFENYFELLDQNTLHEVYVRVVCIFANRFLGGATVFYLTLTHTIFGILAIAALYRILLERFNERKSFKYALLFAFLSPCFYYSSVIIRDIIIVYLFTLGIEIVLKQFKTKNILWLVALPIIAGGVRLYSGLFMLSFLVVYLMKRWENTKLRKLIIPIFAVMVVVVLAGGVIDNLIEQTQEEIQAYQELDAGRAAESGGLSNMLLGLPPVLKETALFFYSQIMPFPSYPVIGLAKNFTQFYQASLMAIFPVWWFFIFYMFFILYVFKSCYNKLSISENMLILFAFIFILVNAVQIGVRRIMPIYPFLYFMSLYCQNFLVARRDSDSIRKLLVAGYVALIVAYMVIKG